MLQETLRVVRVECESPGGPGALQQAHERGAVLLGLLQDADTVCTSRLSCSHAGQKNALGLYSAAPNLTFTIISSCV